MNRTDRHRRWPAWLALLAMLWVALAPALAATALGDRPGTQRVQICTSTGMAWVTLDAVGDSAPSDGAAATVACDWCLLHGGPALPPSAAGVGLPIDADPPALADAAAGTLVPPLAWWRPQPHAPPLLSV
ncbi:DUF2946 family protein [Tepidimonas thermarum]|nr:DUF2946 family protein [Tepidimonas thermarum]